MEMKPIEVLLAEDNDDDILIMQEVFTQNGVTNKLRVVKDGQEAMDYLRKNPPYQSAQLPGLVILDIKMPRKDGFQVLTEIKEDASLRHLPVIMLTTSTQEEDVIRSYRGGACSYVQKPIGFDNFRKVIKELMIYWTLVVKLPGSGS